MTFRLQSSTLPGVRQNPKMSPRSLMTRYKMELEAIEPSLGISALLCSTLKNLMLRYPMAVTHIPCCGVHKAYTSAGKLWVYGLHKQRQWHSSIGHKLHKAMIANKFGEELVVFLLDKFCVIPFECSVARQVEEDTNCHNLAS